MQPAVIDGTFVKIEQVASRKVARLHFEIPIERANEALAALGGFPDPANPVWVAVARLQEPEEETQELPKWKPDRINPATECALVCQKPTFWEFLRENRKVRCEGEDDAATFVRRLCGINTRAVLATDQSAYGRWSFLLSGYEAWMSGRRAA